MNELCHNTKCTGIAYTSSGLCTECELRYNTTNEKLIKLRKEVYSQSRLDIILANKIKKEILRRKKDCCPH